MPCAFAAALERTSPADTTHPANNFICPLLLQRPTPGAFSLLDAPATSLLNPAVLWPDRGAFASKPAAVAAGAGAAADRRLSGACVVERNLALSELGQYRCLNCGGKPGTGIATKIWLRRRREIKARPFIGDVERPNLNL
jgi:hypothetical protein